MRKNLFVLPVGGECLRDRFLVKNEIEEREGWLVGARGHVIVWDVRWGATNAMELFLVLQGTENALG